MKTTLYFTKNGAKLEKRKESIIAFCEGKRQVFPLEIVDKIILFGNIHITSNLLTELSYRHIPIFYYSYGGRYKGVFIPKEKNVNKVRLFQYKTYFDKKRRLDLAIQIITIASKNKLTILKRYYKKHKEIKTKIEKITNLIKKIKDCKSIESLRGFEGNITKEYYSCFNTIFKKYKFDERIRDPPNNEINSLLSFGNIVLYNEITNLIYETGLDMFLGFIHEQNGVKSSLSLDISELFKQCLIDSIIFELINNNQINDKHFNKKEDICMLNNFGKQLFLRKYEKKLQSTFLYKKLKEYKSYKESIRIDLYKLIKYLTEEKDKFEGFRIY